MENESRAPVGAYRSWSSYLLIVILVIGAIVALQIVDLVVSAQDKTGPGAGAESALMQGDFYIKYALVFKTQKDLYARRAVELYEEATPSPGAYRRIGVTRETLLGVSGWNALKKIDSPAATETFSAKEVKEYHREVQLWRDVYGPGEFDKARVSEYVSRIKKLDLGPLDKLAIANVYKKAGDQTRARSTTRAAVLGAEGSITAFFAMIGALIIVGLAGFVLAVLFFVRYGRELEHAPRPVIQYPILFVTFLAYLLSYLGMGVVISSVMEMAGVDTATSTGLLTGVALQLVAMLSALAIGLSVLWIMTTYAREDPRQIGYIRLPWGYSIKWGVGGFAALLPFFAVALLVSSIIFRNVPTPENEAVRFLSAGSPAVIILTVLMAVIAAPVIEETFFRGALYGALRARMSVWGAAVLSAAMFAAIHPLPGHFLPIMVIGTVLALLREKTGSLLPSMICHGLYNGIMLLIALLAY